MIDIVAVALTTAILLTLLGLGLDQLPVRKKMRSVVELVRPQHDAENSSLNFYCWPCRIVHQFTLDDVEKIVYALGVDTVHWRDAERVPPESPSDLDPPCLLDALKWATSSDCYVEHVEQGIECRVKA